MGVASPLQSGRPMEYWLDGLLTKELVALWEFLSRNLDEEAPENRTLLSSVARGPEDLPTAKEVRKHTYSVTMPSSFYACKDRGDPPRILTPPKGE